MDSMIQDFRDEFRRYKIIGEKALAQVPDNGLNLVPAPEANSVAMIVRHVGGNLLSRFTDFLTTDGEKPWRHRDLEFETREYSRNEMEGLWQKGWAVLEAALNSLTDDDLAKTVYLRGQVYTVHGALIRSIAHTSYHVGQIVLLARMHSDAEWKWISIPKGQSHQFNPQPTTEKTQQK